MHLSTTPTTLAFKYPCKLKCRIRPTPLIYDCPPTPDGRFVTCLCRLLAVLPAVFAAFACDAKVLDWLYDVDVYVESQAATERQRRAGGALAEVLMRVSGLSALPANEEIDAALKTPERFYARYEYELRTLPVSASAEPNLPGEPAPPFADEPPPAQPTQRQQRQMVLSFHFEPAAVQALLRRANLPIWAANRPSVLAWIATEQDGQRGLAAAVDEDIATTLAERGRQRGLIASLPLMDIQDMNIQPADVQGRFWERINAASVRYPGDLLLLGSVRRVQDERGQGWQSEWDLRVRQAPPTASLDDTLGDRPARRPAAAISGHFQHRAGTAAEAVGLALDSVADRLADRFAVRGETAAIEVTVRGAQTVRGYASLMRYLQSLEFIDWVYVDRVAADSTSLRLQSRSSRAQLLDLLALGGLLTVANTGAASDMAAADLTWQGDK